MTAFFSGRTSGKEKYFGGKDMNGSDLANILACLIAVIEKTSSAGISAWARYPKDLALCFRSVLDPLHPDGLGMEIFIDQRQLCDLMDSVSGMPDKIGHYESDEYFRPLFEVANMQQTVDRQYRLRIIDERSLPKGQPITEAVMRAQAARFGWMTPPIEVGILLAMALSPEILERLGLQGVVVMHEPIVCPDGEDERRGILWLERRRIDDDPDERDVDAPDLSLITAWWLTERPSSSHSEFPDDTGFVFLTPLNGYSGPA